jgi:sugar phosphate isomerase/epimerase
MITRRELLKRSALLAACATSGPLQELFAMPKNKIKIGACDWSIGKNSDPAAFEVAKQIGLEGIQINMGSDLDNMHLRDKSIQASYLEIAKKTGVKIAGLALGELNHTPYKSDPRTEEWVWDSVDVADTLGVKIILLAFFNNNDLRNDEAGKKEVVQRLKGVASHAEKRGITLGIESYLSAEELTELIQRVGSKSIKVYYDFRNSADAGYDVIKELKFLGRDSICELHLKENGFLLGEGSLDWRRIGETLLEMDYVGGGWMQIEGANPKGANLVESYKHNLQFIKSVFHYE